MEVINMPETYFQAALERVISYQIEGREISITPQYDTQLWG